MTKKTRKKGIQTIKIWSQVITHKLMSYRKHKKYLKIFFSSAFKFKKKINQTNIFTVYRNKQKEIK